MKNYEEVTNRLLERRDHYERKRRQFRKKVFGLAAFLCCFCLVFGAGILIYHEGLLAPTVPTETAVDPLDSVIKDDLDDQHGDSQNGTSANNKIVIHLIDGNSSEKMNIALLRKDFVEMSPEEMIAYYGVDYFPEVPADIPPLREHRSGIFRRNGGTGEIYWDEDKLSYANADFSRMVGLSVNKGNRVFQQFLYFQGTEEKSIINDRELLIGLTEEGYYYSEFMLLDVGFLVSGYGVTEEEFVTILESILNKNCGDQPNEANQ